MAKKTFVLGVGAQKAGTTWLYSYLSSMEGSDFGAFKEYHIFDAVYLPECKNFRYRLSPKSVLKDVARKLNNKNYSSRRRFQNNFDVYYDYFENILNKKESVIITGDITPSYAGLPVECYYNIRENFEKRNINVKVVFLLRDPLERCWSTVRMHRRRNRPNFENVDVRLGEEDALRNYFMTNNAEFRTRYDQTIRSLESAFNAEDLFIGFYETLFRSDNGDLRSLVDFLGIHYVEPDFSKRLNVSKKNDEISEELKADIVMHYSEVYHFVSDRYGWDFISKIWNGAKYLS